MYHIRFTPYDLSFNFVSLEKYDRYIVAEEGGDGYKERHFHILVESSDGVQTVRNSFKADFEIPTTGRGKANKYYALIPDWGDPDYIVKCGKIVSSKGWDQDEILERVEKGKEKYLKMYEIVDAGIKAVEEKKEEKKEAKARPSEWDILYKEFMSGNPNGKELTIRNVRTWIRSYYLSMKKPIPRDGDARRYAFSLLALARLKPDQYKYSINQESPLELFHIEKEYENLDKIV